MTIVKNIDDNSLSFSLEGKKESIYNLEAICEEIGSSWNLNPKNIFTINLILEEIISNAIFYGFDKLDDKFIKVKATLKDEIIYMQINDNGVPFNPLEVKPKPKDIKLEDMEVGGLGIHLVKNLSKSIQYDFIDGENVLKIQIDISLN
jgi:anti-sigma regulatory factor (Ser/Thr protein kinase)